VIAATDLLLAGLKASELGRVTSSAARPSLASLPLSLPPFLGYRPTSWPFLLFLYLVTGLLRFSPSFLSFLGRNCDLCEMKLLSSTAPPSASPPPSLPLCAHRLPPRQWHGAPFGRSLSCSSPSSLPFPRGPRYLLRLKAPLGMLSPCLPASFLASCHQDSTWSFSSGRPQVCGPEYQPQGQGHLLTLKRAKLLHDVVQLPSLNAWPAPILRRTLGGSQTLSCTETAPGCFTPRGNLVLHMHCAPTTAAPGRRSRSSSRMPSPSSRYVSSCHCAVFLSLLPLCHCALVTAPCAGRACYPLVTVPLCHCALVTVPSVSLLSLCVTVPLCHCALVSLCHCVTVRLSAHCAVLSL